MFLFSKPELEQLIKNGQSTDDSTDHIPVAKLYIPSTGNVWLVTEIDPTNPLKGVALIDKGEGKVTYDDVNFEGIIAYSHTVEKMVRRDPQFVGKYPVSVYLRAALVYGFITEVEVLLDPFKDPDRPDRPDTPTPPKPH